MDCLASDARTTFVCLGAMFNALARTSFWFGLHRDHARAAVVQRDDFGDEMMNGASLLGRLAPFLFWFCPILSTVLFLFLPS